VLFATPVSGARSTCVGTLTNSLMGSAHGETCSIKSRKVAEGKQGIRTGDHTVSSVG